MIRGYHAHDAHRANEPQGDIYNKAEACAEDPTLATYNDGVYRYVIE